MYFLDAVINFTLEIMSYLNIIAKPTLLLDEQKARNNLKSMLDKSISLQKKLCPHWKTSQSLEVARWAKQLGINQITVSSLQMARYMSQLQWDNIHIAFPLNLRQIDSLDELASKTKISIQIVNTESLKAILDKKMKSKVGFMIQIDSGYHRAGIDPNNYGLIDEIIELASQIPSIYFKGFYMHPGQTYSISSKQHKIQLYQKCIQTLQTLQQKYKITTSRIGDTPGCSVVSDFGSIPELSPGNFVFYDLMQYKFGSCKKDNIAVCLAAPIVSINLQKKTVLVYGGGVHLSKDFIEEQGKRNYGEIVLLDEKGWKVDEQKCLGTVRSISQEHGVIQASTQLLQKIKIGEVIGILPVHSCMTADCMARYLGVDGRQIDHAEGNKLK